MTAIADGPTVTVVNTWAGHLAPDAGSLLAGLVPDHRVTVELVDAADPRGQSLVKQHEAAAFPLVLVDGAFFSCGRLPFARLRYLLQARCR